MADSRATRSPSRSSSSMRCHATRAGSSTSASCAIPTGTGVRAPSRDLRKTRASKEGDAAMVYQPNIDLEILAAIDVHVHAGRSETAPPLDSTASERQADTLADMTRRSGAGGQTPDETAAWYRERRM